LRVRVCFQSEGMLRQRQPGHCAYFCLTRMCFFLLLGGDMSQKGYAMPIGPDGECALLDALAVLAPGGLVTA
jgi:hypothetical protein